MKVCPLCNQKYADDTLNFCLIDGGGLKPTSGAPPTVEFAAGPTQTEEKTPPQKRSNFWKWFAVIGGIVIVFFLGIFLLLAANGFFVINQNPYQSSSEIKSKITREKFNLIQNGMTFAQINEIIGIEGTETTSSDYVYGKSAVYQWGDSYTFIMIGFVDGKSNYKSFHGLK